MIDLRSDTVTRPTAGMRAAMAAAEVGDDVYGEDPTVNRLESLAAEMIGTEAALFASSGTQSNLLALMSHCQRGDEYIVGQQAHTYKYEAGGAAVLGSIQPQPLELEDNGTLDLDRVRAAIKPDDFHFARTRLLCLENTQLGKVLPLSYLAEAAAFAGKHGLALHLDGARVFNAAVKLKVNVQAITGHFDSVSVCLSKGLGAPVGSVLCGTKPFIKTARRWRKMLGGGMRQAGILAAAGIFALEHQVQRLADDHKNAALLASGLQSIPGMGVEPFSADTNMVFTTLKPQNGMALAVFLKERDILVSPSGRNRLVTHLDVSEADIRTVLEAIRQFMTGG
ncbi:MAG: low-specificity L-threonine aldolase [bacterium]